MVINMGGARANHAQRRHSHEASVVKEVAASGKKNPAKKKIARLCCYFMLLFIISKPILCVNAKKTII